MTKRRTLSIALAGLGLLLLASLAAGCGSSEPSHDYGGWHPDYTKALAGSPAKLAALHEQADELLPGGKDAFEARIASLSGFPVVANVWASWCDPCRAEFPSLQRVSAHYGKRVAFLGVNSEDSDDTARTFLEEAPLSYPSYTDPDREISGSLKITGFPGTAYYGRDGELCYVKFGQYPDQEALEADVRRYAVGSACESG